MQLQVLASQELQEEFQFDDQPALVRPITPPSFLTSIRRSLLNDMRYLVAMLASANAHHTD
jgi:hypothetical protein